MKKIISAFLVFTTVIFAIEQPLFAEELQNENEQSVILLQGDELLAAESTTRDLAKVDIMAAARSRTPNIIKALLVAVIIGGAAFAATTTSGSNEGMIH